MTIEPSNHFAAEVVRTIRAAPPATRHVIYAMLGCWIVLVVLQAFDVAGRSGPAVLAELVSVVSGTLGTLVFGLAWVLHVASSQSPAAVPAPPALHRMRLALPLFGFLAGVLLAFAIGVSLVRVALGGMPGVLGIVIWSASLIVCGLSVADATRYLYARARDEGESAARARAEATEARLAALQAEMNPHFLFNALNTIAALVRSEPRAAERTLENLGDVLRRTLDHSRSERVSLDEELEFVRAYLGIEQARWRDRLAVSFEVAPGTGGVLVPPLTLQPLIENAIVHGIGRRIGPGRVTVRAEFERDLLRLEVEDDGVGFDTGSREGTGLGNLRTRLATLHGQAASLEVERLGHGARVIVRLPAARVTA